MEQNRAKVQHHAAEGAGDLCVHATEGEMIAITLLIVVWVCVTAIAVGTIWQ